MKDRIFRYVVRFDSGAAPNPFGGWCSLAICKPGIRRTAGVTDWIIGLRSRIDSGVDIEDSIVMGSDIFESIAEIRGNIADQNPHIGIGENTVIRRAILDKNVRVGRNVKLLNRDNIETYDAPDKSIYIREGIIIIPKNAVIPDGTEI